MSKVVQLKSHGTWLPWKSGINFNFNKSPSRNKDRSINQSSDETILHEEMASLVQRCKDAGVSLTFEQDNSWINYALGKTFGQNSRLKATFTPI